MSKIVGLTLLLIILVTYSCDSTAASTQFSVTRLDIRKCRCTYISSSKLKCPKQLAPTDSKGKWVLNKCLCRTGNQQNRPELLRFCRALGSATPL